MDPMILASAAVIVIGAVAAALVAVIKQLQAVKLGNKEIHGLVNSAASKSAEKLIALEATVSGLHAAMAALQAQRVTDAQRGIAQGTAQPTVAPSVATQVVEHQVVDQQSIKKKTP